MLNRGFSPGNITLEVSAPPDYNIPRIFFAGTAVAKLKSEFALIPSQGSLAMLSSPDHRVMWPRTGYGAYPENKTI